jgi:hypothetical protein
MSQAAYFVAGKHEPFVLKASEMKAREASFSSRNRAWTLPAAASCSAISAGRMYRTTKEVSVRRKNRPPQPRSRSHRAASSQWYEGTLRLAWQRWWSKLLAATQGPKSLTSIDYQQGCSHHPQHLHEALVLDPHTREWQGRVQPHQPTSRGGKPACSPT